MDIQESMHFSNQIYQSYVNGNMCLYACLRLITVN